ncbi:site-specific integrase [Undibacterium sp. YM2]|uniref:site-specific integrase n=1 Tax=Undibacterium sp. YM2 TaxID=2058625 RepID=UPI0013898F62|nr:site-specific integrase [Undibacterium sp. YM2]
MLVLLSVKTNSLIAFDMDIFDTPENWDLAPLEAFQAFVRTEAFVTLGRRPKALLGSSCESARPMRASATNVYISMFGKFIRYLDGKPLRAVTPGDIVRFLDRGEATKGERNTKPLSLIRVRYLRLFERVYAYIEVQPNPATIATIELFNSASTGRDKSKVALDLVQQAQFIKNLPAASPYRGPECTQGWKKRRDRAMQAIMLGAGLKVSEVVSLYIENVGEIDINGSVPITISQASVDGNGADHRTQLRPFAVDIVMDWVLERKQLRLATRLLFPASLKDLKPLNKATLYRQVTATFERAGIETTHSGGRTLRNSYAFRELQKENASVELVGQFLGLKKQASAQKYLYLVEKDRLTKNLS